MNWNQLLSGKRFGMEEYHERKHERTDFQRDYDRLIFPPLSAVYRTRLRYSPYRAVYSCTTV